MFQSFTALGSLAFSLSIVAFVATQDLATLVGSLSTECQAASGSLLASDFGTCVNITGLLPVISSGNASAIKPFDSWIESICTTAPCSPATVSSALKSVNEGCSGDVQKGAPAAVSLTSIVGNYQGIRELVCLQNTANHSRCVSQLLQDIEKSTHQPVGLALLQGMMSNGLMALGPLLTKAPKDVLCSDCVHALVSTYSAQKLGGTSTGANTTSQTSAASSAFVACGANFTDGKLPSTISSPGAVNSTGSSSGSTSTAAANAPNSAADSVTVPLVTFSVGLLLVVGLFQL